MLYYITGGQPARGTELTSIQIRNTANGTPRGVEIEDGLIVLVTGYYKGFGESGRAKLVHRFLPREVGELLFYYL